MPPLLPPSISITALVGRSLIHQFRPACARQCYFGAPLTPLRLPSPPPQRLPRLLPPAGARAYVTDRDQWDGTEWEDDMDADTIGREVLPSFHRDAGMTGDDMEDDYTYHHKYDQGAHYPEDHLQDEQQQQQQQQEKQKPSSPAYEDPNAITAFSSQVLVEKYNYPPVFHPVPTSHFLDPDNPVSKYPLPTLPLPSTSHLHHRYSPLMDQVTALFMRDGKKAKAQRDLQKVLNLLRTKGPPKPQTKYNLIADHPPLEELPRNPLAYLQTAIDSVAPLMRLKSIKGSGGFSNQVPEPLNIRQRRRMAINWMLSVANGKKDRMRFAERFADEVVAVVEGRSPAWDRRLMIHKTSVGARANVKVKL